MKPWYQKAVFYHIYPLGLLGAPKTNHETSAACRFDELLQWIPHIRDLGCTALYIGPVFESTGHGYDTRDLRLVDRRLGTNEDFTNFVDQCHEHGIRVAVDAVFNHTGREFPAFHDFFLGLLLLFFLLMEVFMLLIINNIFCLFLLLPECMSQ